MQHIELTVNSTIINVQTPSSSNILIGENNSDNIDSTENDTAIGLMIVAIVIVLLYICLGICVCIRFAKKERNVWIGILVLFIPSYILMVKKKKHVVTKC